MTEADRALVFQKFLVPDFDIQEPKDSPRYWFLCCRTCKLTWHLPKNPTRRTKDAIAILAAHADAHREARADSGDQGALESARSLACRACGSTNGPFEHVTDVGAPIGGVPVHFNCMVAFFEQLDGHAPMRKRIGRVADTIPAPRQAVR